MKRNPSVILPACLLLLAAAIQCAGVPEFRDLFNGKDLTGWVNVNTAAGIWRVENGMLVCSGHPIGVMRTERPSSIGYTTEDPRRCHWSGAGAAERNI